MQKIYWTEYAEQHKVFDILYYLDISVIFLMSLVN